MVEEGSASTRPVADGTITDLHAHLVAAVDLELWTIPLYLTAMYSIESDSSAVPLPGGTSSTVTKLLASVSIQEMLHLQIAGNLAVAYGVTPELNWPVYDGSIPYISSLPADKVVKLGAITDPEVLELIIAVETPDPASASDPKINDAPDIVAFPNIQYDANGKPSYASIGDLYSVLTQLVDMFPLSASGGSQFHHGLFGTWYPDVGGSPIGHADEALDVIVDQGEGAVGHQVAPLHAPNSTPADAGPSHPFRDEDGFSHVERFTAIRDHLSDVAAWPVGAGDGAAQQQALSAVFAQLLACLHDAWGGKPLDLGPMFYIRNAVTQVFRAGAVPTFAPFTGDLPSAYAAAQELLAPANGGTWDDNVQYHFTHFDSGGMEANNKFGFDDHATVAAKQSDIAGAVGPNGFMPPGGSRWSQQQADSFGKWDGK